MRYWHLTPFLFLLVRADTEQWVNPTTLDATANYSNNLVWELGSKQVLVYETGFSQVSLTLYQNNNNTFQYITQNKELDNSTTTQSYTWTVGELLDSSGNTIPYTDFLTIFPNISTPFLFYFYEEGATEGFGSSYVNFTADSISTPSSSITTSTITSKPSSTQTPTPLTTTTSTSSSLPIFTSSTPSPSPSHLSNGAKAGIGIGVALSSIALISAILLFFCQWRKHKRTKMSGLSGNPDMNSAQNSNPLLMENESMGNLGPHEVNGGGREVGMGGEVPMELPLNMSYEAFYASKGGERHELDGGRGG